MSKLGQGFVQGLLKESEHFDRGENGLVLAVSRDDLSPHGGSVVVIGGQGGKVGLPEVNMIVMKMEVNNIHNIHLRSRPRLQIDQLVFGVLNTTFRSNS